MRLASHLVMKEDMMPPAAPVEEERWLHGAVAEAGHRGKGPKNYQRSDARIFEDVCEELTRHDSVDASDVEVTVNQGEAKLDGTVATRRMKEMVHEIVAAVPGVKSVRDLLRPIR
jgi:osmotically-inducible protein OsmY